MLGDRVDSEAALSRDCDEEAVSANLVDLRNVRHGANGMGNCRLTDFVAGLDEHDAKARIGVEAVLQQALVALLEYLKRQGCARKQHGVKREQRQCASFWQFRWHRLEYKRNAGSEQVRELIAWLSARIAVFSTYQRSEDARAIQFVRTQEGTL